MFLHNIHQRRRKYESLHTAYMGSGPHWCLQPHFFDFCSLLASSTPFFLSPHSPSPANVPSLCRSQFGCYLPGIFLWCSRWLCDPVLCLYYSSQVSWHPKSWHWSVMWFSPAVQEFLEVGPGRRLMMNTCHSGHGDRICGALVAQGPILEWWWAGHLSITVTNTWENQLRKIKNLLKLRVVEGSVHDWPCCLRSVVAQCIEVTVPLWRHAPVT